jgi:hypothetical protein
MAVKLQLGTRVDRSDALAYAVALADLVAIAVWTWDFFAAQEFTVFPTDRAYFAFGGVIVLLGCLGIAILLGARRRGKARRSIVCVRVCTGLLFLPVAGYALIVIAAQALHNFPQ